MGSQHCILACVLHKVLQHTNKWICYSKKGVIYFSSSRPYWQGAPWVRKMMCTMKSDPSFSEPMGDEAAFPFDILQLMGVETIFGCSSCHYLSGHPRRLLEGQSVLSTFYGKGQEWGKSCHMKPGLESAQDLMQATTGTPCLPIPRHLKEVLLQPVLVL